MNAVMTMKMKFKKNQKGLTLIELLAVIVILGVISAIAVPAISGIISSTKTKADAATKELVEAAILNKVVSENLKTNIASTAISTLVNEGYLSKAPTWNGTTTYANYTATYTAATNTWLIALAT
jgi:type IV pilus assembly protein PilA